MAHLSSEADRRGIRKLLFPHAQDVVSDVPGIVTFCRAQTGEQGWKVLLDPDALLTESMKPNAEDHLWRLRDALLMDFVRERIEAVVERETPVARWWNGPVVELRA